MFALYKSSEGELDFAVVKAHPQVVDKSHPLTCFEWRGKP